MRKSSATAASFVYGRRKIIFLKYRCSDVIIYFRKCLDMFMYKSPTNLRGMDYTAHGLKDRFQSEIGKLAWNN